MTDIRWEDPPDPAGSGRRGVWIERLTPLMEHPKRWAVVATRPVANPARVLTHDLKVGRFQMPPGRWEFLSRTVDGECRVYARYLGPDDGGAS